VTERAGLADDEVNLPPCFEIDDVELALARERLQRRLLADVKLGVRKEPDELPDLDRGRCDHDVNVLRRAVVL
jgi:hypothetical protein